MSLNFELICRGEDGTVTAKSFDAEYLNDIVGHVGDFLHGCGFYFDEIEAVTNDADE